MAASAIVIACGRRDCGHDALGPLVAERLEELHLPGVVVRVEEEPSVEVVDLFGDPQRGDAVELLVIVDAGRADHNNPVGTWLRIDYATEPDSLVCRGEMGTHAISVPEILKLARTLGVLPPTVWVYAGFGDGFEPGASTPEVTSELASVLSDVVACDVCRYLFQREAKH